MMRRFSLFLMVIVLLGACGSLQPTQPTLQPTINVQRPTLAPQTSSIPEAQAPLPIIAADDPRAKGDPDAPVTIIEYSDFECPFCQRHVLTVYPQLVSQHVDAGNVRYVFRNYIAVPSHYSAPAAAVASLCAAQQDQFWPMHDLLFERVGDWNSNPAEAPEVLAQYAAELGLDADAFVECQADPAVATQVQRETEEALALGSQGTPSFFVNQYYVYGAQPIGAFNRAIQVAQEERE